MDMLHINQLVNYINSYENKINIMEVCGTHTMAISRFGLRELLSENINLISGPGCPVCVTPDTYLDYIYDISLKNEVIIATYGDMIRVPGSNPSRTLENAKALGAIVKMVYSSMDAVNIASENPDKKVVFLGIGFETTAPATAVAVREAKLRGISNFYVLSLHKLVEPVMRLLLRDEEIKIDGFLCPGHVGVVIGETGFKFLEEYKCPGSIAGFEMEEIIEGIYSIVRCIKEGSFELQNSYRKLVRTNGNITSQSIINSTFEVKDDLWRGIGLIEGSGLKLVEEFSQFDIENVFPMDRRYSPAMNGCKCGEVLKGKLKPNECTMFGKTCTPENAVRSCMVSHEGSCSAYYKYQAF